MLIYNIRNIIVILLLLITEIVFSQCTIENDYNAATDFIQISNPQSYGQSFVAECDGNIEYFEISEIISANFIGDSEGLIEIYDGTNINSPPIYSQIYEWITMPPRFVITEDVQLSLGNTYTIIVTISNLELTFSASNDNNYTSGSAIIDGIFQPSVDLAFSLLLSDPYNNCNFGNEYLVFPTSQSGYGENFLLLYKFNLDHSGTLTGLGFTGINSISNIRMALYDDLNNVPNNLLAETEIGEVNYGIQILPVTYLALTPGVYWIAFVTDSQHYVYDWKTICDQTSEERYYLNLNSFNNNLPNPFTGGTYGISNCKLPIFAEVSCQILSINENNILDIKIYPNPTSGKIYTNGLNYKTKYTIFSLEGKFINSGEIDDYSFIDVTNLNPSFYFIKFENESIFKFIKK